MSEKKTVTQITGSIAGESHEVDYRELSVMQQAIFDSAGYLIISTDTEGVIRSFNAAASDMLGYTAEEVIGKQTPSIFHDVDEIGKRAVMLSEELDKVIGSGFEVFIARASRGLPDEQEWTYIRKDGSRFPVLLSVSPILDDDGDIDGYLGIAIDITEKVLIERALKEQQERYKLLFEKAGDSIFLLKDHIFVDCNAATLEMFGCSREQIVGQPPYRFSPEYQPDGQSSETKAMQKITAAFEGETQFFEWTHVRYDGTPFDAEVTLNLIEIDKQPHLLANVRDISERKQAERELVDSRIQLLAQNESLRLINNLSNRLHGLHSVQDIVDETLSGILEVTRTTHVAIYLVDEKDSSLLRLRTSNGFSEASLRAGETLPIDASLSGIALKQGEIIFSEDFTRDDRLNKAACDALLASGIASGIVIPLVYQDSKLGCINLVYKMKRTFSGIEKETLYVISNNVSQSLANAHQYNKLEFMAHHDSLTGLPNRSYFHQAFNKRSSRSGFTSAALLLLDLDRFKEINDTLGHHIGDELLQKIGPRLNRVLTSRNILISRLGGDEFTVLVEGVPGADDIVAFAERVLACLREPFSIGQMTLEIDASIGIARYPQDGEDSHALLRSADVAMYEAKSKGSGINLYDREQDKHTPERLALTAELNNAIRNKNLLLHYQPKVDLNSGDVCGLEALVRWQHDRLGLLYPDKFIPLAEVGDSIHHLTREVLDIALRQQQRWFNSGYQMPVSVNLSARNLIDERCTEVLRELLERYGTPRGMLELEITETALMQDADTALQQLMQMADLGIRLSIDDFGTGYSSLSYLRRMPIDALKIDRVFVKDMLSSNQDTAIVSSTIALAHNLGLNVIAEGVEDEATMDRLRDNNCDQVQGYFVCRPAAWDEIERWLNQRSH